MKGANATEVWNKIIGIHNDFAGRQLTVLQDVYKSESDSNQRNQAIGALMTDLGRIRKGGKTEWCETKPAILADKSPEDQVVACSPHIRGAGSTVFQGAASIMAG